MDGWGGVLGDGMRKPSRQMSKSEESLALVPRVGYLSFPGWICSKTGSFNLLIPQNYCFLFCFVLFQRRLFWIEARASYRLGKHPLVTLQSSVRDASP